MEIQGNGLRDLKYQQWVVLDDGSNNNNINLPFINEYIG